MGNNIRYALDGSSRNASEWWLGGIGGAVGWLILWLSGLQMTFAKFIPADPLLANVIVLICCVILGVATVFLARLLYAPIHFRLKSEGGLKGLLREKLGYQMWPIILMASGLFAFVVLFGAGAFLFVAGAKPLPDIKTEAQTAIPYDVEEKLRNIDELFDVVSTRIQDLGQHGQTIVNNLPNHIQMGTADGFLKDYIDQVCPAAEAFRVGLQKLEKFPKIYGPIVSYANTDHPNGICVSCVNVRAEIQRLKDRAPSELVADLERMQAMTDLRTSIQRAGPWAIGMKETLKNQRQMLTP